AARATDGRLDHDVAVVDEVVAVEHRRQVGDLTVVGQPEFVLVLTDHGLVLRGCTVVPAHLEDRRQMLAGVVALRIVDAHRDLYAVVHGDVLDRAGGSSSRGDGERQARCEQPGKRYDEPR